MKRLDVSKRANLEKLKLAREYVSHSVIHGHSVVF